MIGGLWYRILSDEEATKRRNDFTSNQDAVAGIDKLANLIGKDAATSFFNKMYYNLKYEEIIP